MQLLWIVICSVLYYATYNDCSLFIWFSLQLYIFLKKKKQKQTNSTFYFGDSFVR